MVFKIKSLVFIFLRFCGSCVAKDIMGINILYEELGYVFIFNNIFKSFNVEFIKLLCANGCICLISFIVY